jgi:hypothetical protein
MRVEIEAVRGGLVSYQAQVRRFLFLGAGGNRITDTGETRITESGDRRVLE